MLWSMLLLRECCNVRSSLGECLVWSYNDTACGFLYA